MSSRDLYLGVDGGGTKTQFVCIDGDGRLMAACRESTTYHIQVGLEGAKQVLRSGVEAIAAKVNAQPADFEHVFFGLPAYGEDRDIDPKLFAACGEILGHDRYICGNDMVCGWAGSLACADGINIVAGTGSIGYGERCGKSARCGGWGEVFSDEGSAYWIALRGLNAFSKMGDGRIPPGPLLAHLRKHLDLARDIDLCARIQGANALSRDAIAALAPVIATAAVNGDRVCGEIMDDASSELVAIASSLKTALGFTRDNAVKVSWSGGVLSNISMVRDAFGEKLLAIGGFQLVEPLHEPALGAALYARKTASENLRK